MSEPIPIVNNTQSNPIPNLPYFRNEKQLKRLEQPHSPIDVLGRLKVNSVQEKHLSRELNEKIENINNASSTGIIRLVTTKTNLFAGSNEDDNIDTLEELSFHWKCNTWGGVWNYKLQTLAPIIPEYKYLVQIFYIPKVGGYSVFRNLFRNSNNSISYVFNATESESFLNKRIVIINDVYKLPADGVNWIYGMAGSYPIATVGTSITNSLIDFIVSLLSNGIIEVDMYQLYLCNESGKDLLKNYGEVIYEII